MDFSLYGLLEAWQIQSASAVQGQNVSSLFIIYTIVCFFIRRPVFLLAFLLPEIMFNTSYFDNLEGWHLNTVEMIIYSYVFEVCNTRKSKIGCAIIVLITTTFAVDEFLYGVNGYYGERETIIYKNISFINACAHLFFISTLISVGRIRDNLRSFLSSFVRIATNGDYMHILRYNISKM